MGDLSISQKLDATNRQFMRLFADTFKSTPVFTDQIAMRVQSNTSENVYPLLARLLKIRKRNGDRVAQGLGSYEYTLKNESYEGTLAVPKDRIDDDQLGFFSSALVPQLAVAARKFTDRQLAATLLTGKTATTYDGKAFFATDHPISKINGKTTAQANLFTGQTLDKATCASMRSKLAGFMGDDGELLGYYADTIIVGTKLEDAALTVAESLIIPGPGPVSVSNTQRGRWKVVTIPELDADPNTPFYIAAMGEPLKPLIVQERTAITESSIVARFDPMAESVWTRKEYEFAVDGRYGFGFGLWFQMIRCETT